MHRTLSSCCCILPAIFVCGLIAHAFDSKPSNGRKPKPVKKTASPQSQLKLPPLKTPEDKLKFLEVIHQSFPAKKAGSDVVFSPDGWSLA